MMKIKEKLAAYSIAEASERGCIIWQNYLDAKGYGRVRANGRMQRVHRVAWEVEKGPIPEGLQVLHRCDVRSCLNPNHLFLGTQADNITDMVSKGRDRHPVGRSHGRAKLTEQDVRDIRAMGGSQQAIADFYGVNQVTISAIKRRKIWRHLP